MKKYIKRTIFILTIGLFGIHGCTDLDEDLYSEITKDSFYSSKLEVLQAALRPMTHMQAWLAPTGGNGYYYHSELSSDQLAWPQKGRHGYDGGDHFRQHYHTWTSNEGRMRSAWTTMWGGVGYVNAAIEDISAIEDPAALEMTQEEIESILAELYVLRAFHYMKIMELWGNVPVVTEIAQGAPTNPSTQSREEVFEYVKTELETYVPQLPKYSADLVGRTTQTAGYAMLSELYLNAEKWVGTPMWDECIAACDKIISGEAGGINGTPKLADDLEETFANTNKSAPESLYQIAYSHKAGFTFDWAGFFLGYTNMQEVLNIDYSGWNAFVVVPTAYDAYDENDLRKKDWFLFGPQYKYGTEEPVLGTEEWNGQPLVYVNSIRRESEGDMTSEGSMAEGEENSGARFNKYKSGMVGDENYRENHYILYRLTEIYFNKAEALMRKNGGTATQEAVDLVNASRQRAFSAEDWADEQYTAATLTMDELLAERGREFIFEGKRRTDLIRFDKYVSGTWWDHQPTNDPNKEIYPIPSNQLANNPNLEQNPGY
ncbi:RagB/SusD family nutrient uptake outer membrane protein [Sinomicrobium weinanense]|uniref:RagB/SusD family nutrient uptake outer membrane protein n=1 Tax=Sinomicrobium weinanense TaxID=2842200 RepID=A0A926Q371_9FLAO|nr:RagB/SusD family nutrient uptake outer membrane protein [Sinomicrobium weinanense]MBC9795445.1 RagB/SusD family nutrient uptake outer membrane protein [Sinomicrobium weinanense]MBU3123970.1 RagB/SusD family nutrient uptake outer membrane protein [Sinomicrobium weinanense]